MIDLVGMGDIELPCEVIVSHDRRFATTVARSVAVADLLAV